MPVTPSYQDIDRPQYSRDKREYLMTRFNKSGRKIVWEAYIRASYVADWFFHQKGSRRALMAEINAACGGGSLLPLGEPDWLFWPTLDAQTNLQGDVWCMRASWPAESDLAL